MSTFYARITPTNGVSGDVFGVTVSGVSATVEANKTWTSGELAFAITPSGWGNMVITFKNITLNTIIGTKTVSIVNNEAVPVGNIGMGTFTITCGKSNKVGTSTLFYYGYGTNIDKTRYGTLLSSNFRYYDTTLGLDAVWLTHNEFGGRIAVYFSDFITVPETLRYLMSFTNLSTNETMSVYNYIDNTPIYGFLPGIVLTNTEEMPKWARIFTPGQQIRVTITPAATNLQP